MKSQFSKFFFNMFISALIGLIMGLIEIASTFMGGEVAGILIRDSIIGAVIGTVSKYSFIYLFYRKQNLSLCMVSVFLVIGLGSASPSVFYHFIKGTSFSVVKTLAILLPAELLGLSFGFISYKYYIEMNLKLDARKKEF